MRQLNLACTTEARANKCSRRLIPKIILVSLLAGLSPRVAAQTPRLVWAKTLGGPGDQWGLSVAISRDRNFYVSGGLNSTATIGTYPLMSLGGQDAFVAKLTDDGDIVWARSFGGEGDDYGATVAADTLGRVYFAMNAGGPMAIENDTLDWGMVIAGCGVDGSTRWVHQPAASVGKLPGWVSDIAIGPRDGLTVVGSVYYEASFGQFNVTSSGGSDILVAKYNFDGMPHYGVRAGSAGMDDAGLSVAVDPAGDTYVLGMAAGSFGGMNDQCPVTTKNFATFVGKLNPDAGAEWGFCIINPDLIGPEAYDVETDTGGNVYIVGSIKGAIGEAGTPLLEDPAQHAVLAKFDTHGRLVWAVPNENGTGMSITIDSFGNVHIMKSLASGGGALKGFNEDGEELYSLESGVSGFLAADRNGSIYLIGTLIGATTIDGTTLTSAGGPDVFLAKFDVSRVGTPNESELGLPNAVILQGNYPNPFTLSTTISFTIPFSGDIDLRVYDVLGREVARLMDGFLTAGTHKLAWNASGFPGGVYVYRLSVDRRSVQSGRTVLLR